MQSGTALKSLYRAAATRVIPSFQYLTKIVFLSKHRTRAHNVTDKVATGPIDSNRAKVDNFSTTVAHIVYGFICCYCCCTRGFFSWCLNERELFVMPRVVSHCYWFLVYFFFFSLSASRNFLGTSILCAFFCDAYNNSVFMLCSYVADACGLFCVERRRDSVCVYNSSSDLTIGRRIQ